MASISNTIIRTGLGLALLGMLSACQSTGGQQSQTKPAVKANPASVQALALAPAPPANATRKTSLGSGKASVNTANSPGDTDASWVAEIDIDGDGILEETQLLWDDEDRILFAYSESDVPCANGGTAVAALLVGVNGKGNSRGRTPGSGFYAVYLDAGECGAQAVGLYGCKFNASGNVTAWGEAVVDSEGDEIDFTATVQ